MNGAAWLTFAAFPSVIENSYEINEHLVNTMSYAYFVTFLLLNFPSTTIYDRYGLKTGIIIGTLFNLIGAGLKTLINSSFYFVIAGQICLGIAQPFLDNAPVVLSAQWFPRHPVLFLP